MLAKGSPQRSDLIMIPQSRAAWFAFVLVLALAAFVRPGGLHSQADLDRMNREAGFRFTGKPAAALE
jgi:hypothetical protein